MISSFSRPLIGMTVTLAMILISGCATSDRNYTNAASVVFERIPSEDVLISEARAYEDGDELVIYGVVKRAADNCCDAARGHVDIAVLAPDGLAVDAGSVLYSPRNIPKVRSRSSHFMARLPYTIPQGFVLRITYHASPELVNSMTHTDGIFVCQQNMAMPDGQSQSALKLGIADSGEVSYHRL